MDGTCNVPSHRLHPRDPTGKELPFVMSPSCTNSKCRSLTSWRWPNPAGLRTLWSNPTRVGDPTRPTSKRTRHGCSPVRGPVEAVEGDGTARAEVMAESVTVVNLESHKSAGIVVRLMRWASTHTDQSSRRKAVSRLPILDRTPSRLEPEARTPAALLQRPAIWVASPTTLPLIMTHGWPGSVTELLEVVGPLTDPAAHGGRRNPQSSALRASSATGPKLDSTWSSVRSGCRSRFHRCRLNHFDRSG